jgi:hypothetical protein
VIAKLRKQGESGMTDFIAWFDIGSVPQAEIQASMRLFAQEVMPAFGQAS